MPILSKDSAPGLIMATGGTFSGLDREQTNILGSYLKKKEKNTSCVTQNTGDVVSLSADPASGWRGI